MAEEYNSLCSEEVYYPGFQQGSLLRWDMFVQEDLYFVRHGHTDYSLSKDKVDHDDVSLNSMGIDAAHAIEPVIAHLPIKSVCYSGLRRVVETKDIISRRLQARHYEIPDLSECSSLVWKEMTALGSKAVSSSSPDVQAYLQRVLRGIAAALLKEGPVLIVAHGGIHWALCCLQGIADHNWVIPHCVPVHFSLSDDGQMRAQTIL